MSVWNRYVRGLVLILLCTPNISCVPAPVLDEASGRESPVELYSGLESFLTVEEARRHLAASGIVLIETRVEHSGGARDTPLLELAFFLAEPTHKDAGSFELVFLNGYLFETNVPSRGKELVPDRSDGQLSIRSLTDHQEKTYTKFIDKRGAAYIDAWIRKFG